MDRNCPNCAGKVASDLTCHTYGQNGRFYSCMPCDSATYWWCVAHTDRCFSDCMDYDEHEGCGWSWTQGLNPDNPRSVANNEKKPEWGNGS